MKSISVVIPCYNDKEKISEIINQVKKCKSINEIIVVDDGSDIQTKDILKSIRNIKLIKHKKNQGKTAAIKTGVRVAKSDYIFFIDADLINFKAVHVRKVLNVLYNNYYDMIICKREKEFFFMSLIGFATAYSGERIISRRLLEKHKEIFSYNGYLFEPAVNKAFYHQYNVAIVKLEGLTQRFKLEKLGLLGLIKDFRMYLDYIMMLGISKFINQLRYTKWLEKNEYT